jgi:hypothetical protein
MYVPFPTAHRPPLTLPSSPLPVCIITTAVYAQHLGYRTFIPHDAIGSHDLRSWDDKRLIRGRDLVQSACDLMSDAMAVVIDTKDILD